MRPGDCGRRGGRRRPGSAEVRRGGGDLSRADLCGALVAVGIQISKGSGRSEPKVIAENLV